MGNKGKTATTAKIDKMAIYDQEGQNGKQDQNNPSGRKVENG